MCSSKKLKHSIKITGRPSILETFGGFLTSFYPSLRAVALSVNPLGGTDLPDALSPGIEEWRKSLHCITCLPALLLFPEGICYSGVQSTSAAYWARFFLPIPLQ